MLQYQERRVTRHWEVEDIERSCGQIRRDVFTPGKGLRKTIDNQHPGAHYSTQELHTGRHRQPDHVENRRTDLQADTHRQAGKGGDGGEKSSGF